VLVDRAASVQNCSPRHRSQAFFVIFPRPVWGANIANARPRLAALGTDYEPHGSKKSTMTRMPGRDHRSFQLSSIAMRRISTPYLAILLYLEYNVARTVARKGGGKPADRDIRLSRRVDLLTRLTLHAIGRLVIDAREQDWFCAILLTHISYPRHNSEIGSSGMAIQ